MNSKQNEQFELKVRQWLEENPGWFRRRGDALSSFRANRLKLRPLKALTSLGKPALLSSAPLVAVYGYELVSAAVGYSVAGVLFLGHYGISALDAWADRKSGLVDDSEYDISIRVGDLLSSVKSEATLVKDRPNAITATLGIIEGYARLITKTKKGQISVSLAMYNGTGEAEMRLLFRNPGCSRPVNRRFKVSGVLGHYAVQAGSEPRVVNDLKTFGKQSLTSPTRSSVNYRSILFFPVKSSKNPEKKGFLSVDCDQSYAFFGHRAEKIVYMCGPLVSHIEDQL